MTKALFHLRQFRLLLLVLLCALFSLPLSAQEAYVEKSKDETTLTFYYDNNRSSRNGKTWGIDEKKTKVRNYNEIAPAWTGFYISSDNDVVTKVVFDVSFKNFRPTTTKRWFFYLHLISIEGIENLNTSEVTDMSGMFHGCSRLTELNVSNFNTSAVTDMSDMFFGCSGLTELNLSNFNTSAVTNMSNMFGICSGLKELNVSNFNTSAVTNMSYMFSYCSKLTSLNLSNFNTSKVTNMSDMFSGCSGLTSLNLSNFNTSAVKDMSEMFSSCSGLTSLNVSNFNTSAVTKMSYMFSGCSRLTSLNLSNFNTSTVTYMSGMFRDCYGLTSLNLSNFNTSKVIDMRGMFENCSSLKTILNPNTWRCKQSQDMFYGCTQLKGAVKYDESKVDATMANPITGYFTDPNPRAYVLLSEDEQTLTFFYDLNRAFRSDKTWDIDEKNKSSLPAWVGTLASSNHRIKKVVFDASFKDFRPTTTKYWFYDLRGLTTIEGLENFNTSEVTDMSEMFYGCSRLISLNFSYLNTSAVTDMSAMFSDCSGLTSLNLSNFNTSSVTNMGSMFRDCSSLTSLNLSNFNTSAVTNMGGMFSGCSRLTSLNISNFNTSKVTYMGGMFEGCSKLTSLNLSNFNTSAVTNMGGMFSGCSRLTSLNISNFNTSAVTNMSGMFSYCSKLTSLNLSNFNTSAVKDMSKMFSGCSGLTELNVSSFNTSKVTDMRGMFSYCSKLTSLSLSNFNTSAVTDMSQMFYVCSGLKTLLNSNTWRCKESKDMFSGCTQLYGAVRFRDSKEDVEMANPNTGYFTDPNKKNPKISEAYIVLSEDKKTLTFYYDANSSTRSGKIWSIDDIFFHSYRYNSDNNVIEKVVFDESFTGFKPTTTSSWFSHLKALTTIEGIENLNTSAVKDMRNMFGNCSGLKELNLSNFNTSAVTDMREMFSGCSGLRSLNLSNFNTSKVTNMEGMFKNCSGLKELNVSNFNTSAVTDMSYMFSDCSSLKELNVSSFNTSAVTSMSSMFSGCSGLKELNVSNFNTSKVTDMSWMFKNCSSLKVIFNTNTWRCEKSKDMFLGCTQLYGAVKFDASKVDVKMANPEAGYFFDSNKKVAYVQQSEDQQTLTFYYDANRAFRSGKIWNIDEKSSSSKPIWAGTFESPNNVVTKVVFDASFKDFRPTTTEGWFYHLSELATIEGLENLNTSAVTDMSAMFFRCSGLKELNVSNFNTSKVTDMSAMFSDCSGLTSLNLSNFNTSAVTNMGRMFSGCSGLKELNVSNFNTSAVKNMSWMFSHCSGLKELNISNFNTSAVTNMEGMFCDCSGLTSLNLSNFNTSAVTDMGWMFSDCSGLTSLNLSNFNTSKVDDMRWMFENCSGLKTILNSNTWLNAHSQDMFKGCTQLRGAVSYNPSMVDAKMANLVTGYFTDPNPKAYVQQSEDNETLTFYYDVYQKNRSGETWNIVDSLGSSRIPWAGYYLSPNKRIIKVVFDASFKDFRPTTTKSWFSYLTELTKIEGLENLNTSAVTDMSAMFSHCSSLKRLNLSNFNTSAVTDVSEMFSACSSLKELNLSNFNTAAVTDMSNMFNACSSLKELNLSNFNTAAVKNMNYMFYRCFRLNTIYNSNTWQCDKSKKMFEGCTLLNGAVTYDASEVDVDMANPTTGYFTRSSEAYVQQSEDQHTLTFYYDNNRKLRSGKTWDINRPDWAGTDAAPNYVVTKVVFDALFKNFLPTTTRDWFYNLKALTTIEGLENLNTSAVKDMSAMFWGCSRLTSLNLSNFNTSAVTNMGAMFRNCSSLTSLNVSNFNTSKVTDMSHLFDACPSLTSLNVSNFNTSAVTDMSEMFFDCSGLKELNVSNFNTSAVTNMEGIFSGCSGLTSLNLSNFNTSAVTNMSWMFSYCSSLKTIINTQTWQCEKSQDMFKGCTQLNGAVKYDASKLDATMANPTTGYFTDLNRKVEAYVSQSEDQHTLTFYYDNNRKLRSGKTWDIDEQQNASEDGTEKIPAWASLNPNLETTKVVFDASFRNFLPTTTKAWFSSLQNISTIEGIENLNTSAVTDMSGMFIGCSSLKELNVSNFNTSKVTDMRAMFANCSGLKELNLFSFNTSAVKSMWGMFLGCSSLTSLNLSNFNTSAVRDMSGMFSYCSSLKTIINTNTWRCEESQDMFKGCAQLNGAVKYDASKLDVTMANPTTGYFTDSNRKVEAYVLQSEDQHTLTFYYDNNRKLRSGKTWDIDEKSSSSKPVWAGTYSTANMAVTKVVFDASFKDFRPTTTEGWFYHLSELATIEGLENLNTSAVTDMSAMFFRCSGLTSLNLSKFNTSKVTNMGWMFEGCSRLTSLNLSNFNTSAVTNMIAMFSRCPGLKELNVSNFNTSAVKNMSWMFCDCTGLKELNISNFNTSSVTNMSQMFFGSSGLTALNLSNFNTSAVTNMSWMFKNCSGLKELNVSNFNTSAVAYMYEMFRDCSGLKTIFNTNTWRCEQSQNMFYGCTQLKGAVKYDESKVDATMANPITGYFSQKLPSAIGRVVFDGDNATQIYNLQGKRVNANQRHLPAGFYIVNGKKVYLNEKP